MTASLIKKLAWTALVTGAVIAVVVQLRRQDSSAPRRHTEDASTAAAHQVCCHIVQPNPPAAVLKISLWDESSKAADVHDGKAVCSVLADVVATAPDQVIGFKIEEHGLAVYQCEWKPALGDVELTLPRWPLSGIGQRTIDFDVLNLDESVDPPARPRLAFIHIANEWPDSDAYSAAVSTNGLSVQASTWSEMYAIKEWTWGKESAIKPTKQQLVLDRFPLGATLSLRLVDRSGEYVGLTSIGPGADSIKVRLFQVPNIALVCRLPSAVEVSPVVHCDWYGVEGNPAEISSAILVDKWTGTTTVPPQEVVDGEFELDMSGWSSTPDCQRSDGVRPTSLVLHLRVDGCEDRLVLVTCDQDGTYTHAAGKIDLTSERD